MKKILKWVFPALLGIVPVMGADSSYQQEADFLKGETNATVKLIGLRSILVSEKPVDQVRVERADGKKKYITLSLFDGGITHEQWRNDDEALVGYKQKGMTFVLPNDDEITQIIEGDKTSYVLESKEEVTLLNGLKINKINDIAPLGSVVDICSQEKYVRPDQSLYLSNTKLYSAKILIYYNGQHISPKDFLNEAVGTQAEVATFSHVDDQVGEKKETLYPIILKQSILHSEFIRCCHEDWEKSFKGLKTVNLFRHWWAFYDAHKRVTEIFKILDGQEISLGITKTETLESTLNHQDQGKTNRDQCPPNGKSYPPGVGGNPLPPISYTGI